MKEADAGTPDRGAKKQNRIKETKLGTAPGEIPGPCFFDVINEQYTQ